MTKYKFLTFLLIIFSLHVSSQDVIFFDTFESYEPLKCLPRLFQIGGGIQSPCLISEDLPKLAEQSDDWTTWSNMPGSEEDVYVVKDKAYNGENSLYFKSRLEEGGPQNLVLPFGQVFDSGEFTLQMRMYIPEGASASLVLQHESNNEDAAISIQIGGPNPGFPYDEWFSISIYVNYVYKSLTVSLPSRIATSNLSALEGIASLNFYPQPYLGDESEFWIDNLRLSFYDRPVKYVPGTIKTTGITGSPFSNFGNIMNISSEIIDNFQVRYTYGDTIGFRDFTNLNLEPGEEQTIFLSFPIEYLHGPNFLRLKVLSINGENWRSYNEETIYEIIGINPPEHKGVLMEYLTSTRCGECPMGAAFSEKLEAKYGESVITLSSHYDDPMESEDYYNDFKSSLPHSSFVFSSDRITSSTSYRYMEELFSVAAVNNSPMAKFQASASFNEASRMLDFNIDIEALQNFHFNNKLFIALKEDNVTGDDHTYSQSNHFAETNIDACGYEDLPRLISFEDMVYNDVARLMYTEFDGDSFLDSVLLQGDEETVSYSVAIAPNWNIENMSIVVALLNTDNHVNNAYQISVSNAIENFIGKEKVESRESKSKNVQVFPCPAQDVFTLHCSKASTETVNYEILDLNGAVITSGSNNSNLTEFNWLVNIADISDGMYLARIYIGKEVFIKKLQIVR